MTLSSSLPHILHEDWFQARGQPNLKGSRCPSCDARYFPPRQSCPGCGANGLLPYEPPRTGRVLACTVIHVAPAPWQAPYAVAAVELDDGLVVYAHLSEGRAQPGTPVTLDALTVRRADGEIITYAFRPLPASAGTPAAAASARQPAPQVLPPGAQPLAAPVFLAGVGMVPFGKHPDVPPEILALRAGLAAIDDAGLDQRSIQAIFVGTAFGGTAMGQKILRHAPWGQRPVINVENACASGSTALLEAATWVASGRCDVALAIGVDTPASQGGGLIPLPPDDPLAAVGIPLPALYALTADHYLHHSGASARELASLVVTSRRHAAANPYAFFRTPVTVEEVLQSRPVAEPLTLFQCCPNADGAAAAVVVSAARARQLGTKVRLRAGQLRSGRVQSRFGPQSVVALTAREVYEAAGIGPEAIAVAEVHDAYSSALPPALEKLGLAPPYEAAARLAWGDYDYQGAGPVVNPSGGLLSRGHPPGATGLAQVFEVVTQLRGQAGARQVAGARVGLIQNQGGTVLDLETNAVAILLLTDS
ncbi:thiolase C-terminal domain-containing protein [Thermogemmatispora tikiterensis]|nr:zinc ribbon domain-containing protein [Thermogemmatispora tikiterensis]